MMYPSDWLEND